MDNDTKSRNIKTLNELLVLLIGVILPPLSVVLFASIVEDASLKALSNLIAVAIASSIGSISILAINPLRKTE